MKMATGLLSAPRFGGVALRIAAFTAMAAGCWWILNWAMTLDWKNPGPVTGPLAFFAIMSVAVAIISCLVDRPSHLPFAVLRQMSPSEVRIWALLVWLLLIPAEVIVCVIAAIVGLLGAKLWTRRER